MAEDCWRREEGTGPAGFKGSPEVDKVFGVEGEEVFKILGSGTVAASSQTSLGISIYRRNAYKKRILR